MAQNRSNENLKPIIKMPSVENNMPDTLKQNPIIKVSGDDNKNIEEPKIGEFPNYENIDFLRNDAIFACDSQKTINNKIINEKLSEDKQETRFNVHLRKVPKNFTRNRFVKEIRENSEEPASVKDRIKFLARRSNKDEDESVKFLGKRTFDVKPLPGCSKNTNLNLDSMSFNDK